MSRASIRIGEFLIFLGALFLLGQYAHGLTLTNIQQADLIIAGGIGLLMCFVLALVSRWFLIEEIIHIAALLIGAGLISLIIHTTAWNEWEFFSWWDGPFDQSRNDSYSKVLSSEASAPLIEVKLINGRVLIETASRSDYALQIQTRVSGWDDDSLSEMLDQHYPKPLLRDDGFSLVQTQEALAEVRRRGYRLSTEVEISLPEQFTYRILVDSTNGRLRVEQVKASEISLSTSNGSIQVDRLFASTVELRSSNGSLKGELSAATLTARTSNGSINFKLTPTATGQYDVRTSNGSVDLYATTNATIGYSVEAEVSNGRVRVELPHFADLEPSRQRVRGQTENFSSASIQATIHATTSNGSIEIRPQ
jgi:hypothetical protein